MTRNLRPILLIIFVFLTSNIFASEITHRSSEVDSLLLSQIRDGDLDGIRKIITEDFDINAGYGKWNRTLLTYAIENCQLDITGFLLEMNADIEKQDGTKTPLMFAARYCDTNFIKLLLDYGADINSINDERNTAFHYAAKYNNFDVLKLLYERGAKINIPNNDQWTALDYSIINNRPGIRHYLDSIGCRLFEKKLPEYFDGPYISQVDDTTIRVDYMKNSKGKKGSSIISKELKIEEAAEFKGLKKDRRKYRIISNPDIPPSKYDMPQKVFVMGDIHGQYQRLIEMLTVGGVIDKKTDWNYGDGHLVFLGDILDRGDGVMEAYWLIYKLEQQAEKEGGKVHLLLGNHEAMIIKNDIRYISNKYYGLTSNLDIQYNELFSKKTVIGKWLRSKNVIETIGNTMFIHAGISPELANREMSIEEINSAFRHFLNCDDRKEYSELDRFIISNYGPVWYRGYLRGSGPYEAIDQSDLESILRKNNVDQVVVGHTEVDLINPVHNGKVYPVNIPLADKDIIGQALIIKNDQFYRLDTENKVTNLNNLQNNLGL